MIMHTLTISGLDDFEATHVAEILHDYKTKLLGDKIKAIIEDQEEDGPRSRWIDGHFAWHESIMAKVKWTKE